MSNSMLAVLLALLVTACSVNTTDEYLTSSRCVKGSEYTYTTLMLIPNGVGGFTTMPQMHTSCTYEQYTYKNPNYTGETNVL